MATERQDLIRPTQVVRKSAPVHPPFTHYPVALWTFAFVFDLLSLWAGNPMVRAAFYNVAAGTVLAILTGAAGVLDYNKLPTRDPVRRVGMLHAMVMVGVVVLFVVDTWLHSFARYSSTAPLINVIVTGVGLCGLIVGGYLGHKMVFDYGANVIRLAEEERVRVAPDHAADIGRTPIRPQT
jgi:uncharacterized membrane protein